jgi:outer membrane protein
MRVRLTLGWLVVLSLMAAIGQAQQPQRTLSLADALEIARRSNPDFLATQNDHSPAAWQVRIARLVLLTPSLGVNASHSSTNSGTRSNFFGIPEPTPATTSQSYSLGIGYSISGSALAARGQAYANLRATEADIAGSRTILESAVRTSYLNALQAQAQMVLAQRSLERAGENLALAQARHSVGQGTLIDVRRAEVERGQAQVGLLRARQSVTNEQLRLFQVLGAPRPDEQLVLTDSFAVEERTWSLQQLVGTAMEENPVLRSLRARHHAAGWGVKSVRSEFLPSLNFSAGISGNRTRITLDTSQSSSPHVPSYADFTQSNRNPFGFTITASLPIYDRLGRNARISAAQSQEDDLRLQIRARELAVRTDVTAAFNAVTAAWQTIDIQRRNREASAEALELATQRYRVGSGSYIELLDARVASERAEAEFVSAVYDYHRAIAALENAVGRPLR